MIRHNFHIFLSFLFILNIRLSLLILNRWFHRSAIILRRRLLLPFLLLRLLLIRLLRLLLIWGLLLIRRIRLWGLLLLTFIIIFLLIIMWIMIGNLFELLDDFLLKKIPKTLLSCLRDWTLCFQRCIGKNFLKRSLDCLLLILLNIFTSNFLDRIITFYLMVYIIFLFFVLHVFYFLKISSHFNYPLINNYMIKNNQVFFLLVYIYYFNIKKKKLF